MSSVCTRHKHSVHCHSAKINHSHYTNAHRHSQLAATQHTQQTGDTTPAPFTNCKASKPLQHHQQQLLLLRLDQCAAYKLQSNGADN